MASTYTLNNGIELIGTGEQSGTWGDTTNTNLSLLDTALDGQVTVTLASAGTSGSPNTLPISDGAASDGRNRMVIFNDGGDLGATAYVQLTPNDAEKIIYIRNALAGSRSIILFQGTYNASNDYEVPAGTTAVIYFDGAGSGAVAANVFNNAYFDSLRLGSVSVTAILDEDNMASDSATALATQQSIKAYVDTQVGANNELSEVLANGNTSGGNAIQMTTTDELQFRDTALKISSSADGQLDIDADTEVEIVAPTVDIDASTAMTVDTTTLTVTGNTVLNGDLTVDTDTLYVDSTNDRVGVNVAAPSVPLEVNVTGATDVIKFTRDTGTAGALTLDFSGANANFDSEAGGYNFETSSAANALFIKSDGLIGVGTNAPTHPSGSGISIYDTTIPRLAFRNSTTGNTSSDGTELFMSGNTFFIQNREDNAISFATNATTRFTLGNSSGAAVFNDNGNDYDFRIESSSRSNALFLDGSTGGLALNTTNSDFYTGFDTTSIKLGPVASMWSLSNGSSDRRMTIDQNLYVNTDGTNRYLTTGAAARYQMNTGTHRFETAPSGADDAQATDLAVQMMILNSGDVRMGLDNSTAQELIFRTSSSAGRKIRKRIKRGDSGATNAMVQMDMLGYGTNGYLGQMNMYMTPSDTYNSSQIDVFSVYATTGAIFNEDGVSYNDFRVESDNYSHMLFLDASYDHVSIGRTGTANNYNGLFQVGSNISGTVFTSTTAVVSNPTTMASAAGSAYRILQLAQNTGNSTALSFSGIRESTGSDFTTAAFEVTLDVDNTNNVRRFQKWSYPQGNVFNDSSNDIDFRVESNNNTHMLFVEAGVDRVGVGVSNPQSYLDVFGSQSSTALTLRAGDTNGAGGGGVQVRLGYDQSYNYAHSIRTRHDGSGNYNNAISFYTWSTSDNASDIGSARALDLCSEGAIFNENSRSLNDFRVESDTDTHAIFVDAGNNRVNIHASSGENLMNLNAAGSSHTSGTIPPGLTLYNSNTGNGTGNAITWKDATGAQGIAGIASFRTGEYGGYGRDLRFYVNDTASTNAFQEGMRLNEEQMLSTRTVGWSVNSLVEPTVVATSEASASGSIYIDYYLDSTTNQWSTAHFFITISEIDGGASGNAAAWYLVRAQHYNGGIGFSVRDSGGDTASFTTAFSDSGGIDPIAARIGFTSLAGTAVLNVMGANYFGIEKVV
jgi:hypothetical protein